MNDLLVWIEGVTSSPWFYLVVFSIAMIDGFFPVVPGEATVILGGIAAGAGDLHVGAVIACGALGAMAGDSVSYGIGRFFEPRLRRRLQRHPKRGAQLDRAASQITERGGLLLITGRFIPAGRTLITLASGLTGQPYLRWFLRWDILAGLIWASYAAALGYFFGSWLDSYPHGHAIAFVCAFLVALSITALVEVARYFRNRRPTQRT